MGAVAHFERSLQLHPNVAETQNSLGVALMRLGRVPEAAGHFERALSLEPSLEEAHENLGVIFMRRGQAPEALSHFSEAASLSTNYQPHFNYGLALLETGGYAAAAEQLSAAIRLNPDFAPAHDSLGHAYQKLGRQDDAVREYETTRRLAPGFERIDEDLESAMTAPPRN